MSVEASTSAPVPEPQEESISPWTDPPWTGWIETTGDALLILEAARRGMIPRVTRRLVDSERRMITSGSVFVFDEDESGIKRWTDGFFWSPSRILGNFLVSLPPEHCFPTVVDGTTSCTARRIRRQISVELHERLHRRVPVPLSLSMMVLNLLDCVMTLLHCHGRRTLILVKWIGFVKDCYVVASPTVRSLNLKG